MALLDFFYPINFFIVGWAGISLVVGGLGLAIIKREKYLPKKLVHFYKFGKLLPQDRDLQHFGENQGECLRDLLFNGVVRQVPKRWFCDFYTFALFYHSVVFKMVWIFCQNNKCTNFVLLLDFFFGRRMGYSYALPQVIASWLFGQVVIHFARRIYECSCISVYSESTINMLHYLMGFTFYASVGMALVSLLLPTPRALPLDISFDLFIIGNLAFAIGNVIQYRSHVILAQLRKTTTSDGTEQTSLEHKIPSGGLFEYVSCPHYLAEIIIYSGIYITSHFDNSVLALLIWVIVNQTMSALMTHRWYNQHFKTYPKHRRAIFPFFL